VEYPSKEWADVIRKNTLMCGRDVIYIRIIYRTSSASEVNSVYGKTRVESDFT
jgi:hypothetical protein